MANKFLATVGVLAVVVAIGWFVLHQDRTTDRTTMVSDNTNVTVAATFYPLAYFAEQVGGKQVSVINVTPSGAEPHDYEPSPRDLIKVGQAKVVLINGAGLDPWAEKASAEWKQKGQQVVIMSEAVELMAAPAEGEEEGEEHNHGAYDPHFWLDPVRARQIIGIIRDQLILVDPVNADLYRQNAVTAIERLIALDADYKIGLAQCAQHEVVAAHDAYGYLAARYNLTMYPIAGLSPEAEPSARRLAELSDLVKAKKINTIFFETLTSHKLADTLAREAGVKTAVLNPIEGLTPNEAAAGKNYDILMRENLAQLRLALVCQ